jgi:hypothetical protein
MKWSQLLPHLQDPVLIQEAPRKVVEAEHSPHEPGDKGTDGNKLKIAFDAIHRVGSGFEVRNGYAQQSVAADKRRRSPRCGASFGACR